MVDIVKGRFMPTEVVTARAFRRRRSNRHLSAGDIYTAVDETLQMAGYEQDCLLKSVCELAHSPLHNAQEDLYAEILQFILTWVKLNYTIHHDLNTFKFQTIGASGIRYRGTQNAHQIRNGGKVGKRGCGLWFAVHEVQQIVSKWYHKLCWWKYRSRYILIRNMRFFDSENYLIDSKYLCPRVRFL